MHVHIHLYACDNSNERRGHKLVGEWGGMYGRILEERKKEKCDYNLKSNKYKEK